MKRRLASVSRPCEKGMRDDGYDDVAKNLDEDHEGQNRFESQVQDQGEC